MPITSQSQRESICALATVSGRSALAIVRLSGNSSLKIAKKIVKKNLPDRKATYSKFYDVSNNVIDQGIAIYFKAPASFTGEDVVEFQCHGNPIISDLL